jgi:hypothetical protein
MKDYEAVDVRTNALLSILKGERLFAAARLFLLSAYSGNTNSGGYAAWHADARRRAAEILHARKAKRNLS